MKVYILLGLSEDPYYQSFIGAFKDFESLQKWLKEHYPKSTLYEQDKWQPGAFSSYREDLFYYLDEVL